MVGIAVPTIMLSSMASSIAIISARMTTRTLRSAWFLLWYVLLRGVHEPCPPGTYLPPG